MLPITFISKDRAVKTAKHLTIVTDITHAVFKPVVCEQHEYYVGTIGKNARRYYTKGLLSFEIVEIIRLRKVCKAL